MAAVREGCGLFRSAVAHDVLSLPAPSKMSETMRTVCGAGVTFSAHRHVEIRNPAGQFPTGRKFALRAQKDFPTGRKLANIFRLLAPQL